MRNRVTLVFLFGITLAFVSGCGDEQKRSAENTAQLTTSQHNRWYNQDQINRGNTLYQANCASCHKPDASGTSNWKTLDANGKLPPPPLNGSAHTWHHPLMVLRRTIVNGGIPLGGTMPPFGSKLNLQQIDDILAWVQSHWSDEIFTIWNERNTMANKRINKG